jgi:hypothetical protein
MTDEEANELRARIEKLEKAQPKERVKWVRPEPFNPTSIMTLPPSALKALVEGVSTKELGEIVASGRASVSLPSAPPGPAVERSSGWLPETPLRSPASSALTGRWRNNKS